MFAVLQCMEAATGSIPLCRKFLFLCLFNFTRYFFNLISTIIARRCRDKADGAEPKQLLTELLLWFQNKIVSKVFNCCIVMWMFYKNSGPEKTVSQRSHLFCYVISTQKLIQIWMSTNKNAVFRHFVLVFTCWHD